MKDNTSPKKAAALIAALLVYLTKDSAIVYGISAGGLTAIEFAAQFPDKIEKLVLASAISKKGLDENEKINKTAQIVFHPNAERFTWGMVRLFSKFFPKLIAKSFYPQFSTKPSHELKQKDSDELVLALNKYHSKKRFLNDIDQSISSDTIAKIKCPCLIVHSGNDNSVSFMHALHAKDMIEHSTLTELDNAWGHLFWIGKDSIQSIKKTLEFVQD
ncbi:MAG: alpha/beta hydrolase [Saprospiraceae bacterium]|nr:alpha/beta hydrolase [Saprospiraceae bacterium]